MVDRMTKNLRKFSKRERVQILQVMRQIKLNYFTGLEIKKLKDREGVYRVRKGDFRIIFYKVDQGMNIIIAVERRSESTYKEF
jgi:mRNA-degrading endonuclease RelE of RelBE toxin-antitoxin system